VADDAVVMTFNKKTPRYAIFKISVEILASLFWLLGAEW